MLTDFLIVPNCFKDPKAIYDIAIKQAYHSYTSEPEFVKRNMCFPGRRTDPLGEEFKSITDEFILATMVNIRKEADVRVSYTGYPLFHSLYDTDDMLVGDSGLHKDSTLFAAVVYLNDIVPEDPLACGTILYRENQRIVIPYVYNTMIFYRGDYLHGAAGGFGSTIETSRLSMNFFISGINLFVDTPSL